MPTYHPSDSAKFSAKKYERYIPLISAFLGLTVTLWLKSLLSLSSGQEATVLLVLIGLPTYGLCNLGGNYLVLVARRVNRTRREGRGV